MKIDIHTHLGRVLKNDTFLTVDDLLRNMDKHGIDKSAVLPLASTPEGLSFPFTTEQVLDIYKAHSDRIIPFCKLDPRQLDNSPKSDFKWLLKEYKNAGCKGVGELTANLKIDDPLFKNLFKHCGIVGLPVLFHLTGQKGGTYGVIDNIHLPGLENVLKEFPDTIFIGHAMAFWSEISSDVDELSRENYPKGLIKKPGRLQELLIKYSNLYADISADSGFNALTRDPEYGYNFIETFKDKLILGTDYCHHDQDTPIIEYIDNIFYQSKISKEAYENITYKNAVKVLNL